MDPAQTYHTADNGNWSGLLGNLLNIGSQVVPTLINKTDAKQQSLQTPGAATPAKPAWNWKPWAIGSGIIAVAIGLILFLRRR